MRKILPFFVLFSCLLSCKKNDSPQHGTQPSTLCLDTTFIRPNFSGISGIFFITEKDGFVSTFKGDIYKTADSARTWTKMSSNTDLPLYSLCFTDSQTGYAVGGKSSCSGSGCIPPGGIILKTSDGGQTWNKVYSSTKWLEISSVYFANKTLGFCVGGSTVFKTENGGQSWSEYEVPNLGGQMVNVRFSDTQKGYIACTFGKLLTTSDGGTTWQQVNQNINQALFSVAALGSTVYISGSDKIMKSTDGGTSWVALPNSPAEILSLHFINDKTGYAFGRGNYSGGDFGYNYGSIYCTNDGGNTWNGTSDIKQSTMITDVSFPSEAIGYTFSNFGIIKLKVR
ncbi:YCF48-related protein [Chitinophagaceae bacterium 26-R-25]|nr:YCF48-related protein [Chitinophagaceae bacterium 26-R-25]